MTQPTPHESRHSDPSISASIRHEVKTSVVSNPASTLKMPVSPDALQLCFATSLIWRTILLRFALSLTHFRFFSSGTPFLRVCECDSSVILFFRVLFYWVHEEVAYVVILPGINPNWLSWVSIMLWSLLSPSTWLGFSVWAVWNYVGLIIVWSFLSPSTWLGFSMWAVWSYVGLIT